MVYQYVFEEGLEMSLVPEQEVPPFSAGPKVLELGLSGFTGRLIITQQALQQYSLAQQLQRKEEKRRESLSSASSDGDDGRIAPYQARQAAATTSAVAKSRPPLPPDTSKRKDRAAGKGGKSRKQTTPGQELPDNTVDELAAVFMSQSAARPLPVNSADNASVDASVSVVSVASSVSTRAAAAIARKEEEMDQFAAVFAAPTKAKRRDTVPIDDGSSMGSEATEIAAAIAKKEEEMDQFAAVFAAPTKAKRRDTVPIDEGSSVGGSKASADRPDSPLSEFTSAFVALSGPSTRPALSGVKALAIDEESSAAASSNAASSSSESSSAQVVYSNNMASTPQSNTDDPLSEFTAAFVHLSGPSVRHAIADVGGSIDSSTKDAVSSGSSQSSKSVYTYSTDSEADGKPLSPAKQVLEDPLSQFTEAFVALSGPPSRQQDKLGSIDEGTPSASESGSSAVSQSSASTSQQSEQQLKQPLEPVDEYVASFVALSGVTKPPGPTDLIDEDQPSLAHSSSLSSSSSSSSSEQSSHAHAVQQTVIDEDSPETETSSEDPLIRFNKAQVEQAPTKLQSQPAKAAKIPGAKRTSVVPEPPRARTPTDKPLMDKRNSQSQLSATKASSRHQKRRPSHQSKSRRASAASSTKISSDKKKRIREMFPNYPDVGTDSHGSLDPVGVYLHKKCAAPFEKTLTPRDLSEMLEVFPFAAYCADDKGRLPLHILGENSRLVKEPQGRQRATSLARLLIQAYPQSVTYPDSEGRLPFIALLQEWIDKEYAEIIGGPDSTREKSGLFGSHDKPIVSYDKLFPNFELRPSAEWCLNMMAMVLDDMVGTGLLQEAFANRPVSERMEARRRYVAEILQTVPYLLKSVLFIDGGLGAARKRATQNSFFRRALLCKEGVGKWLQDMVKKKGLPSKLAIDYFQLLSQTTPADFVGPKRSPDDRDVDAFHYEREKVYRAIEKLELVIPSLVVLENSEAERAAATNVVWYIMNRSLSQPFVVRETILDDVPNALVPVICGHYIIRKCCEALTFLLMSITTFREHFISLWNLFDILAVILCLVAHAFRVHNPDEYRATLNAVTMAFLWLKVLGFLKFANKEMATFILALQEIFKDIRFFMVVFFVCIAMFADMIHIIITTSDQGYCDTNNDLSDARHDFCSVWSLDYYFRMYAVLLGDFELTDYKEPVSVAVIFFLFTILGVVILLNVLIAVISDSYENSKKSSLLLFGRARLGFVAEQIALESFLRPGRNPLSSMKHVLTGTPLDEIDNVKFIWKYTSILLRWLLVFSLIGSAMTATSFLIGEVLRASSLQRPGLFFFNLFLSVVLLIAIWVVCVFVFGDFFRWVFRGTFRPCMKVADYYAEATMHVVTVNVLGLHTNPSSRDSSLFDEGEQPFAQDDEEDLKDRIFILEKSLQKAVRDTREQLTRRIETTEHRLLKEEKKERALLLKKLSKQLDDNYN